MAKAKYLVHILCLVFTAAATVCAFPKESNSATADSQSALRFESEKSQNSYPSTNSQNDDPKTPEQPVFTLRDDLGITGGVMLKREEKGKEQRVAGEFSCAEMSTNFTRSPFRVSPCIPLRQGKAYRSEWQNCTQRGSNRTIPECFCNDLAAVCCGNLTGIPTFEEHIRYVNLTNNSLTELDDVMLENMTHVEWLTLNKNRISVVTQGAFKNMTSLKCLEITDNLDEGTNIDPKNFTDAVNMGKLNLTLLRLNETNLSFTQDVDGFTYIIRNINLPDLEYLLFKTGKMKRLILSDLYKFPRLKMFAVRNNNINDVFTCSDDSFTDDTDDVMGGKKNKAFTCENFTMPQLWYVDLAYNWMIQFPIFCRPHDNVSVLPALTELYLEVNAIVHPRPHQMGCLDNLQLLWLPGNPLRALESGIFQGFPNLWELDLRYTNVLRASPGAFNHSTLHTLTIKSSNWFMDTNQPEVYNFDPDLFLGSNLTDVDLSYNVFRYVKCSRLRQILQPLHTVKKLKMFEIGLEEIPRVITETFTNIETLGLESNLISTLPLRIFENLTNLNHLNLAGNRLTVPDIDALYSLNSARDRIVYVNLARNPFSCTCDLLRFLLKYQGNGHHGKHGRDPNSTATGLRFIDQDEYKCYSPERLAKTLLNNVTMTQQMCLLSLEQEILISVVCILIIGAIFVYALLYRYRWQVRFWLYSIHVRLNKREEGQGQRPVRFNAFVSYCQKDSNFVLSEVLPALEKSRRIPLCIHERDFVAGTYFSENIIEKMAQSRHVLLVLSNAFLMDDWCRFELFVAQRFGLIQRRIPITLVMLETVDVSLLEPSMVLLLGSTPRIEWPGQECDSRMREMFWTRLGQSLGSQSKARRRILLRDRRL